MITFFVLFFSPFLLCVFRSIASYGVQYNIIIHTHTHKYIHTYNTHTNSSALCGFMEEENSLKWQTSHLLNLLPNTGQSNMKLNGSVRAYCSLSLSICYCTQLVFNNSANVLLPSLASMGSSSPDPGSFTNGLVLSVLIDMTLQTERIALVFATWCQSDLW